MAVASEHVLGPDCFLRTTGSLGRRNPLSQGAVFHAVGPPQQRYPHRPKSPKQVRRCFGDKISHRVSNDRGHLLTFAKYLEDRWGLGNCRGSRRPLRFGPTTSAKRSSRCWWCSMLLLLGLARPWFAVCRLLGTACGCSPSTFGGVPKLRCQGTGWHIVAPAPPLQTYFLHLAKPKPGLSS